LANRSLDVLLADSPTAITNQPLAIPSAPTMVSIQVGIPYAAPNHAAWSTHIDNVTFDLKSSP
jgi:hypothetical protein